MRKNLLLALVFACGAAVGGVVVRLVLQSGQTDFANVHHVAIYEPDAEGKMVHKTILRVVQIRDHSGTTPVGESTAQRWMVILTGDAGQITYHAVPAGN